MLFCGMFVKGPYALITTAVSTDLVSVIFTSQKTSICMYLIIRSKNLISTQEEYRATECCMTFPPLIDACYNYGKGTCHESF